MATADEQALVPTLVERNVINGVLVMHSSGVEERYEITKVPAETTLLVEEAKKQISGNLKLESVLKNLARTSDFLYLAYLGVVGSGELQGRISRRQKDLSELCVECLETMEAFEHDSRQVLGRLTEAYSYLLEANEARALRILSRCASNSSTMSGKCGKLAGGFQSLMNETKEDSVLTIEAMGVQVLKIEGLQKLRVEMEANKKEQEVLSMDVNKSLEGLMAEIVKVEARRQSAEDHSFFGNLFGAIVGAVGGLVDLPPVDALVSLVGELLKDSPPNANIPLPGVKEGLGNAEQPSPVSKLQDDKAIAEKAYEDAKTAMADAEATRDAAKSKFYEAESDNKAKQKLLNAAKKAKPSGAGHEEKVREAQKALDASSANFERVRGDHEKTEADLVKAKENVNNTKAASKAAASALELAKQAKRFSDEQGDKSRELTNSILDMLNKKYELETLRRDANTQLAALTSRLQSNDQFTTVEQSAKTALQIATKALDHIYTSLNEAKYFWDSMQSFCQKLADPQVVEKIQDELADGANPEERIRYYKSERFVPIAIGYLCQWTALVSVSSEYVKNADRARRSVLEHISASPNAEEARELIEPLKKKLEAELAADAIDFVVNINTFEAGAKEVEALIKLRK